MRTESVPLIFRQRVNYIITTGGAGLRIKSDIPADDLIDILTNHVGASRDG